MPGPDATVDAAITTKVKTKFLADPDVKGLAIDVDTKDGVVTIAGSVPAAADKVRIGHLVEKTTGVKSVVNDLTVGRTAGSITRATVVCMSLAALASFRRFTNMS